MCLIEVSLFVVLLIELFFSEIGELVDSPGPSELASIELGVMCLHDLVISLENIKAAHVLILGSVGSTVLSNEIRERGVFLHILI